MYVDAYITISTENALLPDEDIWFGPLGEQGAVCIVSLYPTLHHVSTFIPSSNDYFVGLQKFKGCHNLIIPYYIIRKR
jgi:hypothetical protein